MTKNEEFQTQDQFSSADVNEWKQIRLEIIGTLKNIK